jgi:hypothetical protein
MTMIFYHLHAAILAFGVLHGKEDGREAPYGIRAQQAFDVER